MIKRDRYHTAISGVADELEKLYSKYPQFRGMPPNRVFNQAVKEWLEQKLNKESAKTTSDKAGVAQWFNLGSFSDVFHSQVTNNVVDVFNTAALNVA